MIIIYYSNMIFLVIICFKSHNKFVQQATSMLKFNLYFILFFQNWISPFEITYYEQTFMLTCLLNHNLMQTMWFWVLLHLSTHLSTIIHVSLFQGRPYHLTIHKMFWPIVLNFFWHLCLLAYNYIELFLRSHKFCW